MFGQVFASCSAQAQALIFSRLASLAIGWTRCVKLWILKIGKIWKVRCVELWSVQWGPEASLGNGFSQVRFPHRHTEHWHRHRLTDSQTQRHRDTALKHQTRQQDTGHGRDKQTSGAQSNEQMMSCFGSSRKYGKSTSYLHKFLLLGYVSIIRGDFSTNNLGACYQSNTRGSHRSLSSYSNNQSCQWEHWNTSMSRAC